MDQATPSTASANTLHCALELSKKSWLLAIQFPDREQPSLYPIAGGDAEKLMAKLTQARDRWAKTSGALPMITLCYEVGYDAFWLARFLKARGVECLVIDPGSLQVSRRGRRVHALFDVRPWVVLCSNYQQRSIRDEADDCSMLQAGRFAPYPQSLPSRQCSGRAAPRHYRKAI